MQCIPIGCQTSHSLPKYALTMHAPQASSPIAGNAKPCVLTKQGKTTSIRTLLPQLHQREIMTGAADGQDNHDSSQCFKPHVESGRRVGGAAPLRQSNQGAQAMLCPARFMQPTRHHHILCLPCRKPLLRLPAHFQGHAPYAHCSMDTALHSSSWYCIPAHSVVGASTWKGVGSCRMTGGCAGLSGPELLLPEVFRSRDSTRLMAPSSASTCAHMHAAC